MKCFSRIKAIFKFRKKCYTTQKDLVKITWKFNQKINVVDKDKNTKFYKKSIHLVLTEI